MLPNHKFAEFSFYNRLFMKKNQSDFEFLKFLDRGRYSSNIKVAKSYEEWKTIIENSNLKIIEHKMHLSKTVFQMWDIGLRPLFPVLIKMTNAIKTKEDLIEIKEDWISIFLKFLQPILELEKLNKLDQNSQKTFHYFVLEKK